MRVWQYLKDMVARHIREAKAAAEAKKAAARAAKLRAKLAAAAKEALTRAAAAAAARKEQEEKKLRAQLCSPSSRQKPLSVQQCECVRAQHRFVHVTHPCQATRPSNLSRLWLPAKHAKKPRFRNSHARAFAFAACVTRAQLQAAQAALVKKEEESKLRVRLQFNLSARLHACIPCITAALLFMPPPAAAAAARYRCYGASKRPFCLPALTDVSSCHVT